MSYQNDHEEIDPRLEAMLEKLRVTPERNPQAVERGKANFMAEADLLLASAPERDTPSFFSAFKDRLAFIKLSLSQRAALASMLAILAFIAILFGSAGMTAYAAQSALPGDALYRVKTGLEDTRTSLTADAAQKVTLQLQFAQRRLDEIEALISEGRFSDIQFATQEFQAHIQNTLASMKILAAGDPLKAAELSAQISAQLTRYAEALSQLASRAPESVRGELEDALEASRSGERMELELENEGELGNSNLNGNNRINDDNANMNGGQLSNSNDDDRENANSASDNENDGDRPGNANRNDNEDAADNENGSNDDSGNDNGSEAGDNQNGTQDNNNEDNSNEEEKQDNEDNNQNDNDNDSNNDNDNNNDSNDNEDKNENND